MDSIFVAPIENIRKKRLTDLHNRFKSESILLNQSQISLVS